MYQSRMLINLEKHLHQLHCHLTAMFLHLKVKLNKIMSKLDVILVAVVALLLQGILRGDQLRHFVHLAEEKVTFLYHSKTSHRLNELLITENAMGKIVIVKFL